MFSSAIRQVVVRSKRMWLPSTALKCAFLGQQPIQKASKMQSCVAPCQETFVTILYWDLSHEKHLEVCLNKIFQLFLYYLCPAPVQKLPSQSTVNHFNHLHDVNRSVYHMRYIFSVSTNWWSVADFCAIGGHQEKRSFVNYIRVCSLYSLRKVYFLRC